MPAEEVLVLPFPQSQSQRSPRGNCSECLSQAVRFLVMSLVEIPWISSPAVADIYQAKSTGALTTSLSLCLLSLFKRNNMKYLAEAKALMQFFYHTLRNCLSVSLEGPEYFPPFQNNLPALLLQRTRNRTVGSPSPFLLSFQEQKFWIITPKILSWAIPRSHSFKGPEIFNLHIMLLIIK